MAYLVAVMRDDLLGRLEGVRPSGEGWVARCPAHDDQHASLSVGQGDDGRWLLHCHAGCTVDAVVDALGIDTRDLFPTRNNAPRPDRQIVAIYNYDGVFEVVRYDPKDFRQRRPDGRGGYIWNMKGLTPRLYRLNDVTGRETVIVAEGEKDVDRLWALDRPATCNAAGAGKWKPMHTVQLQVAGVRRVVVIPDADEAGHVHGQAVARACAAAGLQVTLVTLPDGIKDVSAYVEADHDKDDIAALIETATPYEASAAALPAGVVRLSDVDVESTSADGPQAVARLIAHVERVTLLHAREKVGKSTLIAAAVAAVTRGRPFLEQPTMAGDVLWVGEEAVGDVKGRLARWEADLSRAYFVSRPSPDPTHESSLGQLMSTLRPQWVILDTWSHYVQVHGVKDTAGPGEQGLLIGDVVRVAREYQTAITLLHHNRKNPSATAESGDADGEYRDSTALGAAADMIVSMSRGATDQVRRLTPRGRWHEDLLTVVLKPGTGYVVAPDLEPAEEARSDGHGPKRPLTDRVLLHLLRCDPNARPSETTLAQALDCSGRRYKGLRAALDTLIDVGSIDHAQRPGTTRKKALGYALTDVGRAQAEALQGEGVVALAPPRETGNGTPLAETETRSVSDGGDHDIEESDVGRVSRTSSQVSRD